MFTAVPKNTYFGPIDRPDQSTLPIGGERRRLRGGALRRFLRPGSWQEPQIELEDFVDCLHFQSKAFFRCERLRRKRVLFRGGALRIIVRIYNVTPSPDVTPVCFVWFSPEFETASLSTMRCVSSNPSWCWGEVRPLLTASWKHVQMHGRRYSSGRINRFEPWDI